MTCLCHNMSPSIVYQNQNVHTEEGSGGKDSIPAESGTYLQNNFADYQCPSFETQRQILILSLPIFQSYQTLPYSVSDKAPIL